MPSSALASLASTARAQYGHFSRLQARSAGLSHKALRCGIEAGRFSSGLPNVYSFTGVPPSALADAMAAVLYAGPEAALSGTSAAANWGLNRFSVRPIEVSIPGTRMSRVKGLNFRRMDPALLPEITTVNGIPTTSARRVLLELAGVWHPRREAALDQVLREGLETLASMWDLYEKAWMRRRRGTRILRELLLDRSPFASLSQSQLVEMTERIIKGRGLPLPIRELPVETRYGTIHIDLAYPEQKLAIECDGYAFHMDRQAFERDRERDNELQKLGWVVLRFTFSKVTLDPHNVGDTIVFHLT